MIDYEILSEFGTDDNRLREFFCVEEPTPKQAAKMDAEELRVRKRDILKREEFQKWLSGLLQEHIVFSLSNHSKYSAVDMAWDSLPINLAVVPLMQYAQNRIDLAQVQKWLKNSPSGQSFLRKNEKGEVIGVDAPKFFEVNINLIRSIITRRRAAQVQKYDHLWPYYKYEPRDQTEVGKLRADMVSQRMDIMADQYDHRHFVSQAILNMFLYTRGVAFPRAHWEREISLAKAPGPIQRDEKGKILKVTQVTREGISWVLPHPSRIFYDNNYPITSLNTDTGCEYVGFWDVTRWGDIANNANYFNRKKVSYTSGMVDWFSTYWAYFNQYFTTIIPPSLPQARGDNVNFANDRKNQVGLFTGQMEQISTIFTNIYVKVRPQNWGWGKYPHPIWVHLKVAGDATVVYAKIMPSSPCAVFSHNENDARLINISVAHELMPFQDQLTNLTSQLLETIKQDLFSVCVLNVDVFPDNDDGKRAKAEFQALMQNKAAYASMNMLEASFNKMKQLGIDVDKAFTVVRTPPNTHIDVIFKAISSLLDMADRLSVMSPHENGQTASHEISATESTQVNQSVDTIYDFISTGVDEGRAAMKRIMYESTIACSTNEVALTVANRYPPNVVEKAGFAGAFDEFSAASKLTRITGDKINMVHDFVFTTRDGGNRPAGQQAATVLVQMLQAIGSLEADMQQAVLGAMGKSKLFEIFNTIFHSIDAGVDLNLELKPGEPDELLMSQDQQMKDAMQRMAQAIQKDAADIGEIHKAIQAIFDAISKLNPQVAQLMASEMQKQQPQQPQPPAQPVAQI